MRVSHYRIFLILLRLICIHQICPNCNSVQFFDARMAEHWCGLHPETCPVHGKSSHSCYGACGGAIRHVSVRGESDLFVWWTYCYCVLDPILQDRAWTLALPLAVRFSHRMPSLLLRLKGLYWGCALRSYRFTSSGLIPRLHQGGHLPNLAQLHNSLMQE